MTIDFSDMIDEDYELIIDPRDIFFTLQRMPQFSFPRDIQTEVMNRWFTNRDRHDNVIKLNVGSGKTLVGLLVLQSSLNECMGPALYVAPDKQLVQQVMNEANCLGIDTTDDPRNPAYSAGEAICVVNIYKLFNGRSVFGVGTSKINIGTVVIDDAHACVSIVSKQFRIRVQYSHEVYKGIFRALAEDLKGYNEARFLEIESGDPQAYMEVPFWSWSSHQSKIVSVLSEYRSDRDLEFTYPLLRDVLQQCRCFIGGQHLEIEPYFPVTDIIQSFRRSRRCIYMTATLSDDSVIVTHFGADPNSLEQPIVPLSSQSMGERMILMPQELNSELSQADIRGLLGDLAKDVNVVVIVPSRAASDEWNDTANQVLHGDDVARAIEELRSQHVGLTVLVNRYDGIDLPGDACRVLAIVDLPEVSSYADLVDSEVLGGSSVNLRRQIERIEQGMGRAVRSNDDYCAVLLLGGRLTARLRSPEGHSMLTPATKAQIDLSRRIARRLRNPSLEDIRGVISQCLDRDPGWVRVCKNCLVGLRDDDELRLDRSKLSLRTAFESARSNQHSDAVTALDSAIDAAADQQLKAWLLSKKAAFQHEIDASGAQRTLIAAHRMEPNVLKPLHSIVYKKLARPMGVQANTLIENHQNRFIDPIQMRLFADALCSDLHFRPGTSGKFEAAVDDLAWFLGIQSQRPETTFKEGPDNLWVLPNGMFLVIECKNGVASDSRIAKKYVGQLGQSVEWFKARYSNLAHVPVMIHPGRTLGPGASSVPGMRVINAKGLEKLRTNIRSLAQQLTNPDVSSRTTEVAERLTQFKLSAGAFVGEFSTALRR